MSEPHYPAARAFAARLEEHFARHASSGAPPGTRLPDAGAIEALIDAAFWASLQRQEGFVPRISLAFLPPEQAGQPLLFRSPLALGPRSLARLAPAVERPGIHLGVCRDGEDFVVWGTTREIPMFCFVLEVLRPGLLVVKHRRRKDSAKFRNVAVFEGEEAKFLSRPAEDPGAYPPVLQSLLGPESADATTDPVDVLLRLAVSMRATGRGGSLLVVPADSVAWRQSIVQPIAYAVDPPFQELATLVRDEEAGRADPARHEDLGRAVEAIAGLTAVDGATLLTDRYELLGFGVKIARPDGRLRVERVVVTEPIEGGRKAVVYAGQLGGTRHTSGAQFAQDQPDAVALVASQDGRFTVFAWSPREGLVQAHRLETLLL